MFSHTVREDSVAFFIPNHKIKSDMNIQDIIKATGGTNIMIYVTPTDLKEFALAVVEELRATEAQQGQMEEETDELLTQTQAAEYLGVSKPTIWRWQKEKYLEPTSHIGKRPMYSKAALDRFMTGGVEND